MNGNNRGSSFELPLIFLRGRETLVTDKSLLSFCSNAPGEKHVRVSRDSEDSGG